MEGSMFSKGIVRFMELESNKEGIQHPIKRATTCTTTCTHPIKRESNKEGKLKQHVHIQYKLYNDNKPL